MEYKILDKSIGSGNIGYIIEYKGQEYIADITFRSDLDDTEFAIFRSVDRQLTFYNAIPLYRKIGVSMSEEALKECINEFLENV